MPEKSTDAIFGQWHAKKYPPVGHCIYCGSTESLSDEHIIPYGLQPKGGDWFLPKASCDKCANITKGFEGSCLQGTLGPFRAKLNLKSRRKAKSTVERTMNFREDGRLESSVVPLANFPTSCLGFNWAEAGLLRHIDPATEFEGELVVRHPKGEIEKYIKDGEAIKIARVRPLDYARMLAKIAHSYAVARLGETTFEPLLPDLILGKDANAPYLIGGDKSGAPLVDQPDALHDVYPQACIVTGVPHLLIGIRLFAFMGMPRYLVVTGRIRGKELDYLRTNPL
ncbi:HNH endonuclease [Bradyrhizobium sp. ISRA442]|uniref:hypothetical protein n=1 Tax=Bradyrhizobium sp. ISRA442 TaxID=2866197 RepID=UPI00311B26BC